jgi:hypothetical protein
MANGRIWRVEFDRDAARDLRKLGRSPGRLGA